MRRSLRLHTVLFTEKPLQSSSAMLQIATVQRIKFFSSFEKLNNADDRITELKNYSNVWLLFQYLFYFILLSDNIVHPIVRKYNKSR